MDQADPPEEKPDRTVEGPQDPRLRRSVSRRSLLTEEFSRSAIQFARALPSFAPILGIAMKESTARRDERLVKSLWRLHLNRDPKPEESAAGIDLVRKATTPDEKGDALVDISWALCQTTEFEELKLSDDRLIYGFYRIALNREPAEAEKAAALRVLEEAEQNGARIEALEGLLTGLVRSWESVLRKEPGRPG